MVRIKTAKFFNAIRIGTTQVTFIEPKSNLEVELKGNIIRITDTKGNIAYTSLYNVPYWTVQEETPEDVKPTRDTSPVKSSRAKKSSKPTKMANQGL